MSVSALEKVKLLQQAAGIKAQLNAGVKPLEKVKLLQELSAILVQLGKGIAKDAGGDELPELVRKLRDGELATASIETLIKAIEQAEKYLSLSEGIERSAEWLQHNPEQVQA